MSDEEREYLNEMIRSLNNQLVDALRERDEARRKISDASAIMCDWDGFFDPNTQEGNIVELAILIEESYRILNGRSWDKEVAK